MAAAPTKDEGVIIECIVNGALMKVSAVDPKTGTEACVFGPATAREALTRTAVQKLAMVLKKQK
jgi:hypothetical protein